MAKRRQRSAWRWVCCSNLEVSKPRERGGPPVSSICQCTDISAAGDNESKCRSWAGIQSLSDDLARFAMNLCSPSSCVHSAGVTAWHVAKEPHPAHRVCVASTSKNRDSAGRPCCKDSNSRRASTAATTIPKGSFCVCKKKGRLPGARIGPSKRGDAELAGSSMRVCSCNHVARAASSDGSSAQSMACPSPRKATPRQWWTAEDRARTPSLRTFSRNTRGYRGSCLLCHCSSASRCTSSAS
jgi:hypothetical protein